MEEDGNVIVACERCATQFQLDDERVPEDGVRVRCSRCKHAFFIERPPRNEAEKIHRIARRALEDGPSASRDLGPGAASDSMDEEDWKFADDAPFGSEEQEDSNALTAAAANVVDDLLGGASARPAGPSVADLIGDDGMPTRSAAPSPPGDEDSALASTRDNSLLESELDSQLDLADSASADLGSDFGPDEDPTDLLAGLRDELGASDSLEIESGIHLANDPDTLPASQPEAVTRPTRQIVIPQESDELGALADWGLADEAESPTAALGLEMPTGATARVPVEDEPSARALWLVRAGNLAGWVAVIALFAFGLHSGVVLNAKPQPGPLGVVRVGGFAVSHVESTWVDNFHVGPLFVVSGTLRNEAATRGTGVAATWLGVEGEPIDPGLSVVVGPALGEALLRSSHPNVLGEAQQSLREEGWPWNPGEERRFVAVARNVPAAAAWVRFEAESNALPVPAPFSAGVRPSEGSATPADSATGPPVPSPETAD